MIALLAAAAVAAAPAPLPNHLYCEVGGVCFYSPAPAEPCGTPGEFACPTNPQVETCTDENHCAWIPGGAPLPNITTCDDPKACLSPLPIHQEAFCAGWNAARTAAQANATSYEAEIRRIIRHYPTSIANMLLEAIAEGMERVPPGDCP